MQAYLILAHGDFSILEKTLKILDDEQNHFYIHIDKKVKNFDPSIFENAVTRSKVFFVKRYNIQWGSYTMVKAEMCLFKEAFHNGDYELFHLISGVDFPIKSKEEIFTFFAKNTGKEFIDLLGKNELEKLDDRTYRFSYYHFFNNIGVNKRGIGRMNKICLKIQKTLGVDRYKGSFPYSFGSQWASLTKKAVGILLENEKFIKKHFGNSHCPDELYKQTVLMDKGLDFYEVDGKKSNARLIVWESGDRAPHPHTFTMEDETELLSSKNLFARKFSTKTDEQIIDFLVQRATEYTRYTLLLSDIFTDLDAFEHALKQSFPKGSLPETKNSLVDMVKELRSHDSMDLFMKNLQKEEGMEFSEDMEKRLVQFLKQIS